MSKKDVQLTMPSVEKKAAPKKEIKTVRDAREMHNQVVALIEGLGDQAVDLKDESKELTALLEGVETSETLISGGLMTAPEVAKELENFKTRLASVLKKVDSLKKQEVPDSSKEEVSAPESVDTAKPVEEEKRPEIVEVGGLSLWGGKYFGPVKNGLPEGEGRWKRNTGDREARGKFVDGKFVQGKVKNWRIEDVGGSYTGEAIGGEAGKIIPHGKGDFVSRETELRGMVFINGELEKGEIPEYTMPTGVDLKDFVANNGSSEDFQKKLEGEFVLPKTGFFDRGPKRAQKIIDNVVGFYNDLILASGQLEESKKNILEVRKNFDGSGGIFDTDFSDEIIDEHQDVEQIATIFGDLTKYFEDSGKEELLVFLHEKIGRFKAKVERLKTLEQRATDIAENTQKDFKIVGEPLEGKAAHSSSVAEATYKPTAWSGEGEKDEQVLSPEETMKVVEDSVKKDGRLFLYSKDTFSGGNRKAIEQRINRVIILLDNFDYPDRVGITGSVSMIHNGKIQLGIEKDDWEEQLTNLVQRQERRKSVVDLTEKDGNIFVYRDSDFSADKMEGIEDRIESLRAILDKEKYQGNVGLYSGDPIILRGDIRLDVTSDNWEADLLDLIKKQTARKEILDSFQGDKRLGIYSDGVFDVKNVEKIKARIPKLLELVNKTKFDGVAFVTDSGFSSVHDKEKKWIKVGIMGEDWAEKFVELAGFDKSVLEGFIQQ